MKKERGKSIIELIVCLVLVAGISGVGIITGVFESVSDALESIKVNPTVFFRLLVMTFFVLSVQKLLVIVLSFFRTEKNRSATVVTIISSIIRYGSAIVILCWGLSILGVDVSAIATSVGILALIVGFGRETLIEDVITGFFMLFENQYNVGDIVEVNGFRGTVSDIGIRTTSITDAGGNIKIINNSNMKDILNRSDKSSKAVSDIQISYETDIEALEAKIPAMMEEIYNLHTDLFTGVPDYLGVAELGDSGITLRFVVETKEKNIYSAQRTMNRELLVMFKKSDIEIPYPQIDIHTK